MSGQAVASCKLESVEVPIYMTGQRPYVNGGINGSDVRFLVDSGAMFSTIAPAAADKLGLRRRRAPDNWIPAHSQKFNVDEALSVRCRARALLGSELEQALSDCNAALTAKPTPARYDSRGLVNLRMGNLDKAIDDYDEALRAEPKSAWSLLGRGIARVRKGEHEAGRADIAAAKAIRSSVEAEAARYGVRP